MKKNYTIGSFDILPMKDFTKTVFSEPAEDFDEHAFLIKKGEKLRIDIASADSEHYVHHTNNKGLYSEQTTVKIANNTVFPEESFLILPLDMQI